jgi:hypothetical protein
MDEKIREFWRLQLQINKIVGETEPELDQSLADVFPDGRPTDWFNSGIVFSPLVLSLERELEQLQNEVADLQQQTLKALDETQEPEPPDPNGAERIVQLKRHNEQLCQELDPPGRADAQWQSMIKREEAFYEREIADTKQQIEALAAEVEKTKGVMNEWLEFLEERHASFIRGVQTVKGNKQLARKLEQRNREGAKLREDQRGSAEYFEGRCKALGNIVEQLSFIQQKNHETIASLQERSEKHQELLAAYKNVQAMIQESRPKQDEALQQMIDAIELSEKASAQVHKHHLNREMYQNELTRIQAVIDRAKQRFDDLFANYELEAKRFFEPLLKTIAHRIHGLKQEQLQFVRHKQNLAKAIEDQSVDRKALTPEVFLQATEEIGRVFAQKVALIKSNAVISASLSKIAAQFNQLGPSRRGDMVLLRRRRQDLEIQIALLNHTLGDAISRNSMIAEDNERLKNLIAAIKKSSAPELQMAMKDRSLAIERLQTEISTTQQEHAIKIQEMEASIMKFKLLATEYRSASEQTREAIRAGKQEKVSELEDAQTRARNLEDDIRANREKLAKGKGILQVSNRQVEVLQNKLAESQRTSARQSKLILQLARSRGLLADEVQRLQRTSSELSEQIANFGQRRSSDASSESLVQLEPV